MAEGTVSETFRRVLEEISAEHDALRERVLTRLMKRAEDYVRLGEGKITNEFAMVASMLDEIISGRLRLDEQRGEVYRLEERIERLEWTARPLRRPELSEGPCVASNGACASGPIPAQEVSPDKTDTASRVTGPETRKT